MVRQLAEGYSKQPNTTVDVLVCAPPGQAPSVEVEGSITIHKVKSQAYVLGMPISWEFFLNFYRLQKKNDVVFLHHPFPLGFLAAWLLTSKSIAIWYHADITRQKITKRFFGPLLNWVLAKAKVIFVSHQSLVKNSPILPKFSGKCLAVPYGINLKQYVQTDAVRLEVVAIKKEYAGPLVLTVGRLVYYKGFEYLIEAMQQVAATLLIVGSGPLKDELAALINRLRLGDKVKIVANKDSLLGYYYAADVFAFPSVEVAEAFGLVQLEALACGLPVINTQLPTAVPEVSLDQISGLTVPVKDAGALAKALNTLLTNPEFRTKFAAGAQKQIQNFTEEKMVELTFSALTKIVHGN